MKECPSAPKYYSNRSSSRSLLKPKVKSLETCVLEPRRPGKRVGSPLPCTYVILVNDLSSLPHSCVRACVCTVLDRLTDPRVHRRIRRLSVSLPRVSLALSLSLSLSPGPLRLHAYLRAAVYDKSQGQVSRVAAYKRLASAST